MQNLSQKNLFVIAFGRDAIPNDPYDGLRAYKWFVEGTLADKRSHDIMVEMIKRTIAEDNIVMDAMIARDERSEDKMFWLDVINAKQEILRRGLAAGYKKD